MKNWIIGSLLCLSAILAVCGTFSETSPVEKKQQQEEEEEKQAEEEKKQLHLVENNYLPSGSTDVKAIGNSWYLFTFQERHFMFHRGYGFRSGYECIVELRPITDPEVEKDLSDSSKSE